MDFLVEIACILLQTFYKKDKKKTIVLEFLSVY